MLHASMQRPDRSLPRRTPPSPRPRVNTEQSVFITPNINHHPRTTHTEQSIRTISSDFLRTSHAYGASHQRWKHPEYFPMIHTKTRKSQVRSALREPCFFFWSIATRTVRGTLTAIQRDQSGSAKPQGHEACANDPGRLTTRLGERRVKVPNEARWLSAWPRVDRHCRKAELRADAALTGCPRLIKARCRLTTAHR